MTRRIIIAISFFPFLLNAQTKQLKKANENYELHQYQTALDNYLLIKPKKINDTEKGQVQLHIASCYNHLHNPVDAEVYYSLAYNEGVLFNTDQKIEYTKTLIETSNYKQAEKVLLTIDEGMRIEEILLDKIKFSLSNNSIERNINIKSLENKKGYSNYGIFIYKGEPFFIHEENDVKTKKGLAKYKFTEMNGDELNILVNVNLPTNFNSLNFDRKNKIIYYSGNISDSKKYYSSKQYKDKIGLGGINNLTLWNCSYSEINSSPNLLPYSNIDYSNTHPFLTEDGKTIYFASNMLGGYGDYDLYKMEKTEDGWSRPENLGKEINTFLSEGYPFYSDGVLYFSSEGHPGYGGLDIFKFDFSTSKLENMNKPINSSFDDFYYIHISPDKGYFSSNRKNNKGIDAFYIFEKE